MPAPRPTRSDGNGSAEPRDVASPDPLRALRALLLDPSEGREVLASAAAEIGASVAEVVVRSVHERTGRSLSVVYEASLLVDGTLLPSLLVAHADRRGFPEHTLVLRRSGSEVAVWRFPQDPYLPGLPSAVDPGRVRELLDGLGAAEGEVLLRTRAYRPTRRAVVEVTLGADSDDPGRILYLKVLGGGRATRLAEVHSALRPHVPVPRVVGVSGEQGILALEALGGPTLREALATGLPVPEPQELVDLSLRFAGTGLRTRRDPRAFADATRHVESLARAVPELRSTIEDVANAAVTVTGDAVPVHGDLHDGQLLITDGEVTGLLDVDGAGTGLIAEDAGNLVAHVAAIGEVRPDLGDLAEAYAASLAAAYRPIVGAESLARTTAGAWLALATGPFRAQDDGWPEATRRRIQRAVQELSRNGS